MAENINPAFGYDAFKDIVSQIDADFVEKDVDGAETLVAVQVHNDAARYTTNKFYIVDADVASSEQGLLIIFKLASMAEMLEIVKLVKAQDADALSQHQVLSYEGMKLLIDDAVSNATDAQKDNINILVQLHDRNEREFVLDAHDVTIDKGTVILSTPQSIWYEPAMDTLFLGL